MEESILTVKEFLSTIAAAHGLSLESIERTFREEIAADKDFGIFVGFGKHYTIPLDALKKYFEDKTKPKEVVPENKDAFADFMKDVPAAPAAKAPTGKAKDVK